MPLLDLVYLCSHCGTEVKKPGYLGRSWCPSCDSYNGVRTEEREPEEERQGEDKYGGEDHAYQYTTWRPGNSFTATENPDHRFAYVKRTDRLVKGPKGVSYKAKCTCGEWNNPNGFTSRRIAEMHHSAHLAEAEKQQKLL